MQPFAYDRAHGIVELAVDNARKCLLRMQQSDGHWVAELQGDTHPRIGIHPADDFFWGRENEAEGSQGGSLHSQSRKARRRLGCLSRAAGGHQCIGLLRLTSPLNLTGHSIERLLTCAGLAGPYLRLGGAAAVQQLHQVLPGLLGQFPYGELCIRAAGDDVSAALVLFQPLCRVELDADHRGAAEHFFRLQADAAFAGRAGYRRAIVEPQYKKLWPHPPTRRLLTISNFFLAIDQLIKFYESLKFDLRAQGGGGEGQRVDAGPLLKTATASGPFFRRSSTRSSASSASVTPTTRPR